MRHVLANKDLHVEVSPIGAELKSLQLQGIERLWPGESIWKRSSPVLFPVVGRSANDEILVDGTAYPMSQHGFARDLPFELVNKTSDTLRYRLESNSQTKKHYPFDFALELQYVIEGNKVSGSYRLYNKDKSSLPFGLGAHPAFCINPERNTLELEFSEVEDAKKHLLQDGLFNGEKKPSLKAGHLDLSQENFDEDAIVYQNLKSRSVKLIQDGKPLLEIDFRDFPHFGIWSKPNTREFLCLEPWLSHAQNAGTKVEFKKRPEILTLDSGQMLEAVWAVKFY